MRVYLLSLGAGLLVGVVYSLIAPGLPVQRVTHGIVQGHRSALVPGLIERFGG